MRIIGGSLGGRRIKAPPGSDTRPTSDRVREAIFNILGEPPAGTRVLDPFAGSGALGFEALSRGAIWVAFVESSRPAARSLRENIATLGLTAQTRVHVGNAITLLARWQADRDAPRFRWVFLDPPYRSDLATRALDILGSGTLVEPDAVVIVEHDRRHAPANQHGSLVRTDNRRYGDTEVSFYAPRAP